MTHREFVCSYEGLRDPKHNDRLNRVNTERAITRCRCPARLQIKFSESISKWYVVGFEDVHSHPFAIGKEVPFLRSHRKIDVVDKHEIEMFSRARVRKVKIMDIKLAQNCSYPNVGFIKKDLYNHCDREMRKKVGEGDAQLVLNCMRKRQEKERSFVYYYDKDEEGHLTRLFWADTKSRLDYLYFSDVLMFDSTFRTNKYKMPFVPFIGVNNHGRTIFFGCGLLAHETIDDYVWLLSALMKSTSQKLPTSVVTDGDLAMKAAVALVFPDIPHRICSWHIKRNLPKNLRSPKHRNAFKILLYRQMPVYQFYVKWEVFRSSLGEHHKWADTMYSESHMWAESFFKGHLFLGIRTTQCSESMNALLNRHLDRKMTLHDLVCHYEICVGRTRMSEANPDDFASHQCTPYLCSTALPILKNAADIYTPNIFKLVSDRIKESANFEIANTSQCNDVISYMVCDGVRGSSFEYVYYQPKLKDPIVTCSCKEMESRGIPCKHILCILIHHNQGSLPASCILSRWTKNRRYPLPPFEINMTEADELAIRYEDLVKCGKRLFLAASKIDEAYIGVKDILSDYLNNKLKRLSIKCHGEDDIEVDDEMFIENVDVADNPNISVTKGAPKKRLKFWSERRRPYRCSNCHGDGHQACTCPNGDGEDIEFEEE